MNQIKIVLFSIVIIVAVIACNSDNKSGQITSPEGIHKVLVEEAIQATQYTYLRVKEGNDESWIALPKMQAAQGETYYYKGGMLMNDFESKELNRKFKEILFIDRLSSDQVIAEKAEQPSPQSPAGSMPAENDGTNDVTNPKLPHTVVSEEVLQTKQYTYIRAKENSREIWLAVAKMEATAGKTYYFTGGLQMTDFPSKELNRTFKEILFVDNIHGDQPAAENNISTAQPTNEIGTKGSAIDLEKKEIRINHAKDEITIAKLLENKKSFSGKTIKLKGQVTKFNAGIMKKNWIHLQDGTEFSGKFDLVVTTDELVKTGDNITVEGVIALDKDFGYGYFYEVIMEDARLLK